MTRSARLQRLRTTLLCALACVMIASPAATQGPSRAKVVAEVSLRPPPGLRSHSLRFPWDGQLLRGMRLRESQYVRYVPEYVPTGRFYGTWELVQLLERAARRVGFRLPGAKLSMGEISSERGGDIGGHRSHESGRDADVGFFMTDPQGRPYSGQSFAEFDGNGRGLAPNGGLRFDDARNWELVAKLVNDADARVQYIFVSHALRQRLLQEAARRGASAELISRAAALLVEPAHGNPHRSHFHVRVYCAPADRPLCKDVAPFWPWYPSPAHEGGLAAENGHTHAPSTLLSSPFGSAAPHPAFD
ncbi:MAG TPA: penicillin-insensitive murein endopeptidase [Polyangiales bacterium]